MLITSSILANQRTQSHRLRAPADQIIAMTRVKYVIFKTLENQVFN